MFYRLLLIFSIVAATVGYSIYQKNSVHSQLSQGTETASVLAKLPPASFTDLEGQPFKLHDLYKNGAPGLLVVHFWGTWCAPCEAELPELISLVRQFEGRPEVKFLLVAVNDEVRKVQKHIKAFAQTKALWLMDNGNSNREFFGTTRVPETFVFSSDMALLRKYLGPQAWNKPLFFQTLDEFLQLSTRKL